MLSEPSAKGIFAAVARGGIKFDIVKSGFQKGIRRNLPDLAVPLALRGLELGFMNKSLMTNLLNRMVVICGEDIGPACVSTVKHVDSLIQTLRQKKIETETDKRDVEITLTSLVAFMCAQKKTRVLSFVRSYYGIALDKYPELIDDELLEVYNRIKSQKNTLLEKWENALLSDYPYIAVNFALKMMAEKETKVSGVNMNVLLGRNTNKVSLIYACWMKIYEQTKDKDTTKILFKWFREENEEHIYLLFAHVLLLERERCNYKTEPFSMTERLEKWRYMAYDEILEIPDFVVDWHTKKGRQQGAGKLKFALDGSKVENEYKGFDNLEAMREVYVEMKKREDEHPPVEKKINKPTEKKADGDKPKENVLEKLMGIMEVSNFTEEHRLAISKESTFVGQIISARWKPQTYMIREGPLKGKIMKGPYPLKEKMVVLAGRVRGFAILNCRTPPIEFLAEEGSKIWLQMDAFARTLPEEWEFEERMDTILGKMVKTVKRESLGTTQLWNKTPEQVCEFLFGDYFLYRDYVVAAAFGCGDMGPWNCLVSDKDALIIDFEDSTTRTKIETAWGVFAKCPNIRLRAMIEAQVKKNKDRIFQVMDSIKTRRVELASVGIYQDKFVAMLEEFFSK